MRPGGGLGVEGGWRLRGLRRGWGRRGHMPGLGLGRRRLLLLLLLLLLLAQLKGLQHLQWRLRGRLGLELLVLHLWHPCMRVKQFCSISRGIAIGLTA